MTRKVLDAAKQALQELAPEKTIELDDIIGGNPDAWLIGIKDIRGGVLIAKKPEK